MNKNKNATQKCNGVNFAKNLAQGRTWRNISARKTPSDHRNVSPEIKEMWEVYLGFAKLDF